MMNEQARKLRDGAIPEQAQGVFYVNGLFSEVLAYHDDEALYFELRGENSSVVRFPYEMLETLGEVIEEEKEHQNSPDGNRR